MTELQLPFQNERGYAPDQLAAYCSQLHESGRSAFVDPTSGLTVVWRYPDVQRFMMAAVPEVSNKNSLNPLVKIAELARHPANWRPLAQLLLHVTPSTANAPRGPHGAVKRALVDRHHPASLRAGGIEARYGAIVDDQVGMAMRQLKQELGKGVTDFAAVFAGPVAAGVIGDALGYPRNRQAEIVGQATAQASLLGCQLSPAEQPIALGALNGLWADADQLIRDNEQSPGENVAGLLASKRRSKPPLTRRLASSAVMNVEAAGFITSYGMVLNGLEYYLSEGREHWGDFTPNRLKEVQRIQTPLWGWKRKTTDAVTLADGKTIIPSNTEVIALIGAANRDPNVFPDPDVVRPERYEGGGQALPPTFGLGRHHCVGESLATLGLTRALQAVHAELPGLQLAGSELRYKHDGMFRIPQHLPVRL